MRGIVVFLSIFLIFLLFSLNGLSASTDDRGLMIIQGESSNWAGISMPDIKFNTINSYSGAKLNNMKVLLVANDDYLPESGFAALSQCVNDAILYEAIFKKLCRVPENNITILKNTTANEFARTFKMITSNMKRHEGLLINYSGHGDNDGSLVFVDGSKVFPNELKTLVNSIDNDTTLILDACYSGNNEGPLDVGGASDFRKNTLRIYASLAHMTAKEISYKHNPFFNNLQKFYQDVLGIDIDGNGYFTSLIGYFFAEYDVSGKTNISFRDIMEYITNKSKQYLEFLAIKGVNAGRGSTQQINFLYETGARINQLPKIYPLRGKVNFINPDNEYILIKKYTEPAGIMPEIFGGPYISFSNLFGNRVSGSAGVRFTVSPYVFRGFFVSLEASFLHTFRPEDPNALLRKWDFYGVNLLQVFGADFFLADKYISLGFDAGLGVSIVTLSLSELNQIPAENGYIGLFAYQTGFRFIVYPVKNFSIFTHIQFAGFIINERDYLIGVKIPIGLSYKF